MPSMTLARRLVAALLTLALVVLAAGCGSSDDKSSKTTASASKKTSCEKGDLTLVNAGQLTVATDKPAYPPYFEDDDPANGKGFESAVAFAIAKELGFSASEVKWIVEPFDSSYAPGEKDFDFDVNQISITPKRSEHVDFSAPYYQAPQAVVALKDSESGQATDLAGLSGAQLGVQIGTTSLDAATASINPSKQPKVFNNSNDVVRALKQGQVDAVVVDLPTAFYLTAAQVPEAKIVGQFTAPGGDEWGALLGKDSELTSCVTEAVETLRSSGQLEEITQRWMGGSAGAPELL